MVFEQQQFLIGTTHLSVRAQSLYVCQRNPQGLITLETEVPFEDMLPIETSSQRRVPLGQLLPAAAMLAWLGYGPWHTLLSTGHASTGFWLWLAVLALNVGGFWLRFERQWSTFRLRTARLVLTLAGRPWQRERFAALVATLELRSKDFLRGEYGGVNPLGPIEPQLRRVRWLRDLGVLTPTEARTLSTRLTGRLSGEPLRGMGQVLEGVYVN